MKGCRQKKLVRPLLGVTLSLCFSDTSSAQSVLGDCGPVLALGGSAVAACEPGTANGFELNAMASDSGAFWSYESERAVRGPLTLSLTREPEIDRAITFRAQNLTSAFGEIAIRGGVSKIETSDALTFDRVLWPNSVREANTVVGVGVADRAFNGRLVVSTDLAWSTGKSAFRFGDGDLAASEVTEHGGSARWHSFEAKLIDSPAFAWSMAGEISVIDEDFVGHAATRPRGAFTLRGERTKWSTRLAAFGATAAASVEEIANRLFTSTTDKFKLDFDGVGATVYSKEIQLLSPEVASVGASGRSLLGANVELTPQLLAPEWFGQSPLAPELLSLNWEGGLRTAPVGSSEMRRIASFEALASWNTSIGVTTALYWRAEDVPEFAGTSPQNLEQLFDFSHTIKRGDLRLSAGASVFDMSERDATGGGISDTSVSANFSLTYAPASGPQIGVRLGHTRDEFALDLPDDLWGRQSASYTLSASIDLSTYVQKQLDRPGVNLRADYRRTLDDHRATDTPESATEGEAFLVSFDTSF